MPVALDLQQSQDELAFITRAFSAQLRENDLVDLLAFLNARSCHRFTGVYRFDPGWVVSVALFDRESPDVHIGADVKMKESYCWLTGLGNGDFIINDARSDARLDGHAARDAVRSYLGVQLRDRRGRPWGTLCHFDFAPHSATADSVQWLADFRPLIEEMFVRDADAQWEPDVPSRPRVERTTAGRLLM